MIDAFVCLAQFDASATMGEVMIAPKLALPARLACLQFAVSSIVHVLVLLDVRLAQTTGEQITGLFGVSTAHMMG